MTDRVHALTVVLDRDIREDDVEPLMEAILMLRHVYRVKPRVVEAADEFARDRARAELRGKFHDFMRENLQP